MYVQNTFRVLLQLTFHFFLAYDLLEKGKS